MQEYHQSLTLLGLIVVVSPLVLTVVLGISSLLDAKLDEQTTTNLVHVLTVSGLVASVAVLASMLGLGTRHVAIDLGNWVVIPHHYHFSMKFIFDRLSVPFA